MYLSAHSCYKSLRCAQANQSSAAALHVNSRWNLFLPYVQLSAALIKVASVRRPIYGYKFSLSLDHFSHYSFKLRNTCGSYWKIYSSEEPHRVPNGDLLWLYLRDTKKYWQIRQVLAMYLKQQMSCICATWFCKQKFSGSKLSQSSTKLSATRLPDLRFL